MRLSFAIIIEISEIRLSTIRSSKEAITLSLRFIEFPSEV
ncbi:hypothetical protein T190607A01A_40152 [Tenacibaculum sp. 190524A05c]|uniref:Uncharacterized protein n=1 Tax=Tenacibaculum platacis TaxID=3137852 RepID=A0ABP1ESW6_9FLAO